MCTGGLTAQRTSLYGLDSDGQCLTMTVLPQAPEGTATLVGLAAGAAVASSAATYFLISRSAKRAVSCCPVPHGHGIDSEGAKIPRTDPFQREPRAGWVATGLDATVCSVACRSVHINSHACYLTFSSYLNWDDYFMSVAFLSSQRSKDPHKQVGHTALLQCV